MAKVCTIGVRVTEEFKKNISLIAEKKGLTTSEYLRYLLIKELEKGENN